MSKKKKTVPIVLSDTSPSKKQSIYSSFGVGGESFADSFDKSERRIDTLKLSDYRQMIDNDGQIQMLLSAINNTILSAGYEFIDGDAGRGNDSEELQFIKDVFTLPYWNDGMKIPLELVMRYMLRAFVDGFRVFEMVYKKRDDGKIVIDKIAPRGATTDDGIKLLRDENDNFLGFWQRVSNGTSSEDVEVTNKGIVNKVILCVYGAEYGSLYGRSGLKPTWYHYDKAHKSMYLNHVGHELGAVKFRKLMIKTAGDEAVTSAVGVLERPHIESVIALGENAFDLVFESASDASVMQVGLEQQDRHYAMISKSLLAQFLDLGSNDSSGSRALGETQAEFFKQGLQSIAGILIEQPINLIISDLIKLNYGSGIIPTFKINPIDDKSSAIILEGFMKLIEKGLVPQSVQQEIMQKASDKIGLDIDEDVLSNELASPDVVEPTVKTPANLTEHVHLNDMMIPDINERPLFPDEYRVKFSDIKSHLDETMIRSKMLLTDKLSQEKVPITEAYVTAIRDGAKAVSNIEINLKEEVGDKKYSEELLSQVLQLLEYGKILAANELLKGVPNTSKADRDWASNQVESVIAEQEAKLKFRLQEVANIGLNKKIPEQDMRTQLQQEFDAFVQAVVTPTVAVMIPKVFNQGRQITFSKYEKDIFAYRWSAKLERSCSYCTAMDGKVVQSTDPQFYIMTPPAHFGCMCMWVAITNDSRGTYNVQVTGVPSNIQVYGSVSQFKGL